MRGWRSVLLCLVAPVAAFGHLHLSDDPRIARQWRRAGSTAASVQNSPSSARSSVQLPSYRRNRFEAQLIRQF